MYSCIIALIRQIQTEIIIYVNTQIQKCKYSCFINNSRWEKRFEILKYE